MKFKEIIFVFLIVVNCFSQETVNKVLEYHNKKTIPYITVEEFKKDNSYVILDTREANEYHVSHIKNAVNVGFDSFNSSKVKTIIKDKNTPIVVYCSIGIRSEKIGEKLKKMGYTNVQNLYGGIFEWKNNSKNLVDKNDVSTINVHTYSKKWSRFLTSGNAVYEK